MGEQPEGGRGRPWRSLAAMTVLTGLLFAAKALGWELVFNVLGVALVAAVIWQACEPFADAAQWLGDQWHIPGSVRGATLDAVASSLPELFTGLFFVVAAAWAAQDNPEATVLATGEGYGATVATCAGSAVYNMILIPAFVALVISIRRPKRPTVDIEDSVIARDGVAFLLCEIVLLICLFSNTLHWWMALLFVGMYVAYVVLLYLDWRRFQAVKRAWLAEPRLTDPGDVQERLQQQGLSVGLSIVSEVRGQLARNEDEPTVEEATVLFGLVRWRLSMASCWIIIFFSTLVAAIACYFLVEITREMAHLLGVPTFFIAVIVAAAASSVPGHVAFGGSCASRR